MNNSQSKHPRLAEIPQVDWLLQQSAMAPLLNQFPRPLVVETIRNELSRLRKQILENDTTTFQLNQFVENIARALGERFTPTLQRAVNATGIILHTNMGRAPLSLTAREALKEVAEHYSNLEFDLSTGKRGNRYQHVESLLCQLTGAEAAMVVNNNAAATFLVINTLAFHQEIIVSRGELITIGDSFRLPEIMRHAGARMVEIGTTNQTYLSDYTRAITPETALLMKIHTSNYKIIGFTAEASLAELVEAGQRSQIPVYHDVGSGALIDLSQYGLPKEPVIKESIATGVDIVSFSGDKLIGGPQSGIIVGKKEFINRMKKNQLTRTLRAGKLTYAALEATLRLFLDEAQLMQTHAVLQLMTRSLDQIEQQARHLIETLPDLPLEITIEDGLSEIGGGSLATESLPTRLLKLSTDKFSAEQLALKLREQRPPIVSRIHNDKVTLDLRTVREDENQFIVNALQKVFAEV